jgi:capsular polysaccharide biosynthesis protein
MNRRTFLGRGLAAVAAAAAVRAAGVEPAPAAPSAPVAPAAPAPVAGPTWVALTDEWSTPSLEFEAIPSRDLQLDHRYQVERSDYLHLHEVSIAHGGGTWWVVEVQSA